MKKFFLSAILFLMGSLSFDAAYNPAPGPMVLADRGQTFNARGAIMEELIKNQNNPGINAAWRAIVAFERRPNLRPYQEIMTSLSTSTETNLAIDALKGFETVIMHLYNYRAYLYCNYDPIGSIFVTGIRASWFHPLCYGPKSWVSDNDPALKQLIDELAQVANLMYNHSVFESARLKTMVHSYRHWRLNLALSCAAYLMFDIHNHGYDQSIIKQFGDRGFMNTPGMIANHASNFGHSIKYGYKGTKFVAKNYWKYIVKPVGKFMLGGWNYAFGAVPVKAEDEKKKNIKPVSSKAVPVKIELNKPAEKQSTPSNVVDQKNQIAEEDSWAYLSAPSAAQLNKEFCNIEQEIAKTLQPKVVAIDKQFIDKGNAVSSFVQNDIHQKIQDEAQENYAVLQELATECKAYVLQQEYDQARSSESVGPLSNISPSTDLIQTIARDHNMVYQPAQINSPSNDDPFYVQDPVIDLKIFSPKEWAIMLSVGFVLAAGIEYLGF